MHIEDTLQPGTVNEVLLIERIRELRIALLDKGNYDTVNRVVQSEPVVSHAPPPITLNLAASLETGWENERFHITAHSYGPDDASFGFHRYVPAEILRQWSPIEAAKHLEQLHKETVRKLASLVRRGRV